MINADFLVKKLMTHYGVFTITELSAVINIGQPAISKWIKNNSMNPIKKKCRELGIYNEIFSNLNTEKENPTRDDYFTDIISYSNIHMKKILKNWGVQGYGIAVGIILHLKMVEKLDEKNIDLLADDLKTSVFLVNKIIEDCELFKIENNIIELNIKENSCKEKEYDFLDNLLDKYDQAHEDKNNVQSNSTESESSTNRTNKNRNR